MILAAFTRWSARSRLDKARRAYAAALARYKAADERQDMRKMHEATLPLQQAHRVLIEAELAALPRPSPLLRGAAR